MHIYINCYTILELNTLRKNVQKIHHASNESRDKSTVTSWRIFFMPKNCVKTKSSLFTEHMEEPEFVGPGISPSEVQNTELYMYIATQFYHSVIFDLFLFLLLVLHIFVTFFLEVMSLRILEEIYMHTI